MLLLNTQIIMFDRGESILMLPLFVAFIGIRHQDIFETAIWKFS